MSEKTKEKKKNKRPTALKRQIQNDKKHIANRSFRSKTKTAMKQLEIAIKKKDEKELFHYFNQVYSLADKGFKKNVYTQNKSNRLKAQVSKWVKNSSVKSSDL